MSWSLASWSIGCGTRTRGSGFVSTFYSTQQPLRPRYVRYEIDARVDGADVRFSDDPARDTPARFGSAPIEVSWQGATIDLANGQLIDGSRTAWLEAVDPFAPGALDGDRRNAFRFRILVDHTAGVTVEVLRVRVVFRS